MLPLNVTPCEENAKIKQHYKLKVNFFMLWSILIGKHALLTFDMNVQTRGTHFYIGPAIFFLINRWQYASIVNVFFVC